MNRNKFFRYVWRINAIIILFAGLMAIVGLGSVGVGFFSRFTRDRNTRNIVNIQEDAEVEETWQFGHLTTIEGTPYTMIPLNSYQSYTQSYYGKSTSSARNYLFFDGKDNERHWLLDTNKHLIIEVDFLSDRDYGNEAQGVKAILYKIVKEDNNEDDRLTASDIKTIGISMPSGRGYKEIIDGIDGFLGYRFIDEHNLLIAYQRSGVAYSANIGLTDFVLSNVAELPKVGP